MSVVILIAVFCCAQSPIERKFTDSPDKVQAALKNLAGGTSGPLPVLDGFVNVGEQKLAAFKRPFYQCTVRVTPSPGGGSLVRVSARITAWSSDPAHSGYEVLPSNGRIEGDLLDRLSDALNTNVEKKTAVADSPETPKPEKLRSAHSQPAEISAPMPQFPSASAAAKAAINSSSSAESTEDKALEKEAQGLEELLQSQSHPTNLVAVKQDQTPILQNPSADATVLFYASAQDEFEILDTNPEWVHVRISGLSRGWLRRANVEVLDGSEPAQVTASTQPATSRAASSTRPANKLFSVSAEEQGTFPGDWTLLKGKTVKIISIQQAPGTGRITSPQEKMQFAESVFKSDDEKSAGVVLIFDAEDGGMVAATRAVIDSWKAGGLSPQAFWKQCYLDPPEILGAK